MRSGKNGRLRCDFGRRFDTRHRVSVHLRMLVLSKQAGVAQLVEHLICNQRVGGSNPSASSNISRVRLRGAG